ncbi:protein NRT1/ PTR FAMILY 3.1 [Phalaenopsis equestris]|uniref:protein NRT1/ PTR FAMILY 3.1 n=1 Tax=Phalaenopsis equestris TaxID=78828 RepID=UPI0009E57084|nr:protein NRT1/ PTR FAMILY 3.1 [Phalaenopsis equestris]
MEDKEEQNAGQHEKWKGGIKTMPFIFANEVSEKLAVVGFSANMVSYLTEQLHMPVAKAATTLTNFGGTASLTPLLGAFLADAYIGRFWTIAAATFIYLIGMSSLTISATLPQFRPPPCSGGAALPCKEASTWQIAVLYVSLLLAAIGAGGIRPCVVAFGAEQFGEADETERRRTWRFFNWYYFCMGASMLMAVTVVVYVQDNVGWGWGLGLPTIAMGISLISFIAGYPMYRNAKPAGSPFTRLAQVVAAAVRKRRLEVGREPGLLYENDEIDKGISMAGKLSHTSSLRFLDKAAILTEQDKLTPNTYSHPNLWHLSTVHRVEELKSLIRMAPIWAAGILAITAAAQQNTFSLQQARTMNRRISPSSSFQIPPGSMTLFTMLSMLLTISLYDRLLVPLARRFTGLPRGISFLLRMGIGFAISASATLIAGFVELHRRRKSADPISVFWLVPQYGLFGASEAFTSIGHLEFFYDQSPESMRSTAAALFWLSISAGSYGSTVLVGAVHRYTDWLVDDLNKGRLEYLYWIITGLQVLNLGYYVLCARFYVYKPLRVEDDGGGRRGEGMMGS